LSEDLELLQRWRAGEEQAGTELFRRHIDAVRRFFRNKVSDDVEDLVQRTFLGCVEGRDRFRGESSFRTYLFGVARNVLSNHIRHRSRRDERLESESTSVSTFDTSPSASMVMAKRREQRVMLEALRGIPLDFQIALELYYWENLSARELGEVLDIPEGTARSRIRRGKVLLEMELEKLGAVTSELVATRTTLDKWARDLRDLVL
jgi:RNA polymerase sigma-70 factor (ECF subfamily)